MEQRRDMFAAPLTHTVTFHLSSECLAHCFTVEMLLLYAFANSACCKTICMHPSITVIDSQKTHLMQSFLKKLTLSCIAPYS